LPVLDALCRTLLRAPSPRPCTFHFISRGRSCALRRILEAPITQQSSSFPLSVAANGAGHGYSGNLEPFFTCYVSKGAASRRCVNLNLNPSSRSDHIESREAGQSNHRAALQTEKRLLLHPDWLPGPIEPYHTVLRLALASWLAVRHIDNIPVSCHFMSLAGGTALQVPASKCHCRPLLPVV
jgi:hypothetical protein